MIDSSWAQEDLPELLKEKVLVTGTWRFNPQALFNIRLLEADFRIGHCDPAQLAQNQLFTRFLEENHKTEVCRIYYWDFDDGSSVSCSPGFLTREAADLYIAAYNDVVLESS